MLFDEPVDFDAQFRRSVVRKGGRATISLHPTSGNTHDDGTPGASPMAVGSGTKILTYGGSSSSTHAGSRSRSRQGRTSGRFGLPPSHAPEAPSQDFGQFLDPRTMKAGAGPAGARHRSDSQESIVSNCSHTIKEKVGDWITNVKRRFARGGKKKKRRTR